MTTLTLFNGDCLELMKDISANSIDLIICDLPYGCLANGYRASEIHPQSTNPNQNINKIEFKTQSCSWDVKLDLDAFWKEVKRIRKSDHSPTIHFCTTKFGYELIQSNPNEFRYDLVWDKQRGVSFLSANKMPMRSHEMIYIFSKAGAFYERKDYTGDFAPKSLHNGASRQYNQKHREPAVKPPEHMNFKANCGDKGGGKNIQYSVERQIRPDNTGKRCVLSVVQHPTSSTRGGHPTEKPEALYRFLIERYCPVGGTVLDPTFGSGNSVFTAFDMGRNAIGIEKDPKFYKKAAERLEAELCPVGSEV